MTQITDITEEQIALVQTTFQRVAANAEEAADRFYDRLFTLSPQIRPLFPTDMHHQGDKFMATLAIMIYSLERSGDAPPFVQHLGLRHNHHGIPHTAFAPAWQALLQTLAEMLGSEFTPEVEQAWEKMFDSLTNAMLINYESS